MKTGIVWESPKRDWFVAFMTLLIFVVSCDSETTNRSNSVLSEARKHLTEGELIVIPEERQRKLEKAIDLTTRAIKSGLGSNELYVDALQIRARAFRYLGQNESAIDDLDVAISIDQDNLDLVYERAMVYQFVGEPEDVISEFTRLIDSGRSYPLVYRARGYTYMELGRYSEAIEDFGHAITDDPSDMVVVELRGDTFAALSKHNEAISDYSQALKMYREWQTTMNGGQDGSGCSFGEQDLRLKLADSYEHTGKLGDASAQYECILEDDPTHPEARDRLAALREETDTK